jgi:dTDP-4-dehydrorhamnose 3,5-epimerase
MAQIEGVSIIPLRKIPDERGAIFHMLKSTDSAFKQFGEIYFSMVHPGIIKGWHVHKIMTLNYAVIVGKIKLVLYDKRENSQTKGNIMEIFMGEDNYCLVTVPPGVVNGFKGVGSKDAIVANCASHAHDPLEIERIDPFTKEIPYDWGVKHG